MRAECSILDSLLSSLGFMHVARQGALRFAVEALLAGRRLILTALGRTARGDGAAKHSIKRIDRLLGNRILHSETAGVFSRIADFVIGSRPRPIILIDWTPLGRGSLFHALVASVPSEGRALILYTEVVPLRLVANAAVERRFVSKLLDVLPARCRPIFVTDAGFRTPWFDLLRGHGVDFVGRLRHRSLVQLPSGAWMPAKTLHSQATKTAKDLGLHMLTRSRPRPTRLVLVRKSRKHRTRRTARGLVGNSVADWRGQACAREPWLLVTSLTEPAERVVAIYATRMQIEETFRDLKNHRFGWSLEDARCTTPARWRTLLLLAACAAVVVMLVGRAAENAGLQRDLIANTSKRRVFSCFTLGLEVLAGARATQLDWRRAWSQLTHAVE